MTPLLPAYLPPLAPQDLCVWHAHQLGWEGVYKHTYFLSIRPLPITTARPQQRYFHVSLISLPRRIEEYTRRGVSLEALEPMLAVMLETMEERVTLDAFQLRTTHGPTPAS